MFKHPLAATSLALALMSATAIAQTTAPAPATPAAPNSTVAPSTAAPAASGAQSTLAPENQAMRGNWRASKLMGVDIYGPDNEKVGDVTEVLIDNTGKITGITVGVGGFLGIGAKDVAVKFEEVNWSMQPMTATATGTAATGTNAGTTAPGAAGTAATAPRATGTAGTAATAPMDQMYPDHGKINMTKDQLKAAPAVTYSNT
ncbi:MAG: PRC-barrel domain-containing protein [Bosea sp. (in: a-proteobacteria)]|uniref:PRC-barrel domain-containing protein n=1 Tax=Bosea sp. (in: a-proteobacteria) TaxID=1871050 RepID=UPI002732CDFF|nr:PRC-barrel domain-containing protein [Bosea sp. (in: a-proteobacteria)]MDP3255670.1 PRC-barrel domain-containing protein [Bosea sp. (in: a-proteobacteria)]MDP3318798.1 PRC-barrel domain-containing protein [Bosea sp. (in: a-proteobacteria)]